MNRPSGDQLLAIAFEAESFRSNVGRLSAFRSLTYSPAEAASDELNTARVPSADQIGATSWRGSALLNRDWLFRATSTSQRLPPADLGSWMWTSAYRSSGDRSNPR